MRVPRSAPLSPWTRRRAIVAALTLLLFLAGAGCRRAGESEQSSAGSPHSAAAQPLPGYVLGQVVTYPGPRPQTSIEGIEPTEVGSAFRHALLELPIFGEEGAEGPVIHFALEWSTGMGSGEPPAAPPPAAVPLGSGQETQYVVFYLSATGAAEDDPVNQFEAHGIYRALVLPPDDALQTARRLMAEAITDLAGSILAEGAPRCASDGDLVALLDQDDPDRLLPAIREVHRRRLENAVPALRDLLASEDPEIILAAATALGRLQDARSVGPLIDIISRRRRDLTEFVLPILGQINSLEARVYLETVADAHENPLVRRLAQQVLEQIEEPR